MQGTERGAFVSLRIKMCAAVFVSFCAAVAVYFLISIIGNSYVREVYLSNERTYERANAVFNDFEAFVKRNGIRSDDTETIMRWCAKERFVFVSIYDDTQLLFETDGEILKMGSISSNSTNLAVNNYTSNRIIHFADGAYRVNVIEYTEARFSDILSWVSVICAVCAMFISFLYFMGRIVSRISSLSQQFSKVGSDGGISPIHISGNDELSQLSKNAELMRKNIVSHYENEQRAYKANTELMTALSHDIRTPLTSLLLYSDALSQGKVTDAEDVKKYASVCFEKATQLKNLTDTMFRYFLLFTDNGNKSVLECFDASQILSQLVYEYEFALEQKGFNISITGLVRECRIQADASVLKRVFDNIFSNLEKYADKSKQITVTASEDSEHVRVSVINYISSGQSGAESNRIGLRSCKKLMSLAGGAFEYGKNGNLFESLITLPKCTE